METCSNCGATLRPGAKFCTTCGTRLNSTPASNAGWGQPAPETVDDRQETSVLEAVEPPAQEGPARLGDSSDQREYDRWTAAYSNPATPADDPASRFISALEQDANPAPVETPEEEQQQPAATTPAATWVTPPPEAFQTGRPSTWNFQTTSTVEEDWKAPATWNTVGPPPAETEVERTNDPSVVLDPIFQSSSTGSDKDTSPESEDVAPALPEVVESIDETADGTGTVADVQPAAVGEAATEGTDRSDNDLAPAKSADTGWSRTVNADNDAFTVNGDATNSIAPEDARARAITLIDELRSMVRMMPGGNMPDMGAAAMGLTEASLNLGNFDDLRDAISELQEDPRDIQALSNLARMADKIEVLLDEHQSLAAAIETALQEMSGQH